MAAASDTQKTREGSSPPALRPTGSDGFSLLEVLVATALMGLVLVVLLQVLTSALRSQEAAWRRTQAVLVAEKLLAENCQINTLRAGTYQGQEARYDYLVRISPQEEWVSGLANQRILCSLIQVTVTWQERGVRKTLELQTLRTGVLKGS
jgi:prepilin-type N-terminal cleavage/methylation domain-containing protein